MVSGDQSRWGTRKIVWSAAAGVFYLVVLGVLGGVAANVGLLPVVALLGAIGLVVIAPILGILRAARGARLVAQFGACAMLAWLATAIASALVRGSFASACVFALASLPALLVLRGARRFARPYARVEVLHG